MNIAIVGAGNVGQTLADAWGAGRTRGEDLQHHRLQQHDRCDVRRRARDDAQAKTAAAALASELGFDPVDCGPLLHSRYLENFAVMWIWLAMKGGLGRDVAWKLLRR